LGNNPSVAFLAIHSLCSLRGSGILLAPQAPASAASSSTGADHIHIIAGEGVPAQAMSLVSLKRAEFGRRFLADIVTVARQRFQMIGVRTSFVATAMVENDAQREWAAKMLVNDAMNALFLFACQAAHAISELILASRPDNTAVFLEDKAVQHVVNGMMRGSGSISGSHPLAVFVFLVPPLRAGFAASDAIRADIKIIYG
jgi:hypothetical protein